MKIALVSLEAGLSLSPPIGLSYLATYLEKKSGIRDIVVVDGSMQDVHARLKRLRPDFIGLSAMSLHYGRAIRVAREAREYSKAQVVIGGVHISTMPQSLKDVFDFGVLGEGEETLREVTDAFMKKGGPLSRGDMEGIPGLVYRTPAGGIAQTPARPLIDNLDDIPRPDMKYFDRRYFMPREEVGLAMIASCAPMMTARGCPYRCVFCSTSAFWDRHRNHSVPYVVENIRYLVEDLGVRVINILDDMFIVNKKRLLELRSSLEQNGLLGKTVFTCNARANHIDDEMCGILRSLGVLNLNFGFESGSDRMLRYLKVGSVTVEKNREAIRTCKRHGLVVYGSLMMGCPGETVEDMKQTLDFMDFAKREKADYLWSFVATPFPKTEFWEEAKKRGKVSDDMDWEHNDEMSHHNIQTPLLTDMPLDEFGRLFREGRKKLRGMRYRMLTRFVLRNPAGVFLLVVRNIPYYAKRFYFLVFRF